ncbi:MAG: hypothetical protein AABX11_03735 [Nanoarchaeota archaeon]
MRVKNIEKTANEGILVPTKEVFKIKGNILYQESAQAWNTIKIRKEIINYFYSKLKDKRGKFGYTMIVPRSLEETKKEFEEIEKNTQKIPILLYLEEFKEINPE